MAEEVPERVEVEAGRGLSKGQRDDAREEEVESDVVVEEEELLQGRALRLDRVRDTVSFAALVSGWGHVEAAGLVRGHERPLADRKDWEVELEG